ncbi:hypothetical protein ACVW2L_002045 [Mucilaginibacter sp. HD30]
MRTDNLIAAKQFCIYHEVEVPLLPSYSKRA